MLAIRLSRVGGKKKPYFRVVVLEKSVARDGRALEILGHYNPVPNPAHIEINRDRVQHWVDRGAHVSETVENLLRRLAVRQDAASAGAASSAAPSTPAS